MKDETCRKGDGGDANGGDGHDDRSGDRGRAVSRPADGTTIPMLGLGVWQIPDGEQCVNAVRWALELGYRHIDTAQAYGNEESVGRALRDSGVARDDVYITTKFYPGHKDPSAEAEKSLVRLGVDHVDLYIVHWPQGGPTWAWPGMERAREQGYTRSIGISNFSVSELEALLASPPSLRWSTRCSSARSNTGAPCSEACERRDVAVEAYSPLGTGRHLSNRTVNHIARRVGRTPAQVLVRWCLQQGLVVIPKSTHRERIEENGQVFDFELSAQDMAELSACDQTRGTDGARDHPWW